MTAKRTNTITMTDIRRAVRTCRGGHEHTDDAGLRAIWDTLSDESRREYLTRLANLTETPNAALRRPESDHDVSP